MINEFIFEKSGAPWQSKILLLDDEGLEQRVHYSSCFSEKGFDVIVYKDDLSFRLEDYDKLKDPADKIAVIAKGDQFVPYDVYRRLSPYRVSLKGLFPKLNENAILSDKGVDFDLLSEAYEHNYDDLNDYQKTDTFLQKCVYSKDNVEQLARKIFKAALNEAEADPGYRKWFDIAEKKARIDALACKYEFSLDTSLLNTYFKKYVLTEYGKLYLENNPDTPVLVSRAMEYMCDQSSKFAIIVMDGMSEFDWDVLSTSFKGMKLHRSAAMAMIPTITSISRQSLLGNKNPVKLIHPWKQDKEKEEFVSAAKELGFNEVQIAYLRDYGADPSSLARCVAVIIMDCDEMVHSAQHGRKSMFYGDTELSKGKQLRELTERLLYKGFDVYITADHGNTECIGIGKMVGTGVETETRSHRMIVLKDFANKMAIQDKHHMFEFPGYYLPEDNSYLLCEAGESLDPPGDMVMSHGGITLDEVVVPFIKIKAVENNG